MSSNWELRSSTISTTNRMLVALGRYLLDFKAYFFGGLAAFYNNPKAQLDGQWIALQPLNTENLDKKYSRIQMALPVGFGFYYTFSRIHRFGLNAAWRFTFTDYIDDASTTVSRSA